jgi:hypothetical protein
VAGAVRFTKAERSLVQALVASMKAPHNHYAGRDIRTGEGILEKLEKSELVRGAGKAPGLGWTRAAAAMRAVLGPRLAVPPSPDIAWIMKMSNRIRDLGLTELNCRGIAGVLLARTHPRYHSFERAIWDADKLLAEAQLGPPTRAPSGPVGMEDL